jgi:hypothetical protein
MTEKEIRARIIFVPRMDHPAYLKLVRVRVRVWVRVGVRVRVRN